MTTPSDNAVKSSRRGFAAHGIRNGAAKSLAAAEQAFRATSAASPRIDRWRPTRAEKVGRPPKAAAASPKASSSAEAQAVRRRHSREFGGSCYLANHVHTNHVNVDNLL